MDIPSIFKPSNGFGSWDVNKTIPGTPYVYDRLPENQDNNTKPKTTSIKKHATTSKPATKTTKTATKTTSKKTNKSSKNKAAVSNDLTHSVSKKIIDGEEYENVLDEPIVIGHYRKKYNSSFKGKNYKNTNIEYNNEKVNDLTFDIPVWSVNDYIVERANWQKQLTSLTGEPGWFYFKIFFDFSSNYGLLGGLLDYNNRVGNNALQYLDYLNKSGRYNQSQIPDRINTLTRFIKLLSYINTTAPWFFKGITGLDKANGIQMTKFDEEKSIEISTSSEAIDMRLNTLMDLYKYSCYDMIQSKEIIPENLRKFDMTVMLFSIPIRYHDTSVINSKGKNPIAARSTNGKTWDTQISYKMLTFKNCEFDVSTLGAMMPNQISNETSFQLGGQNIKITYDRVYGHTVNSWDKINFGANGIYDAATNYYYDLGVSYEERIPVSETRLSEIAYDLSQVGTHNFNSNKHLIDLSEYIIRDAVYNNPNSLGNLYGDFYKIGNNYFDAKMKDIKEGTISGNIYEGDYGVVHSIHPHNSHYLNNKIKNIKNGTISGNIYEYEPIHHKDRKSILSGYLLNKIKDIKRGTIGGNIYNGKTFDTIKHIKQSTASVGVNKNNPGLSYIYNKSYVYDEPWYDPLYYMPKTRAEQTLDGLVGDTFSQTLNNIANDLKSFNIRKVLGF